MIAGARRDGDHRRVPDKSAMTYNSSTSLVGRALVALPDHHKALTAALREAFDKMAKDLEFAAGSVRWRPRMGQCGAADGGGDPRRHRAARPTGVRFLHIRQICVHPLAIDDRLRGQRLIECPFSVF